MKRDARSLCPEVPFREDDRVSIGEAATLVVFALGPMLAGLRVLMLRSAATWLVAVAMAAPGASDRVAAQGHGPVYGLSTPTLGQGGWSLDVAGMGRFGDGGRMAMVRPMVSYGVTEDLQLSISAPISLAQSSGLTGVRAFTRMPASRDAELMLGWRFQRQGTGIGARQETTLWIAADVPMEGRRDGLVTAPSLYGALVTGYASRTVYLWVGGVFERSLSTGRSEQRAGDVRMASLVIGYRPPAFRRDYPSADWRGFIEIVGESVTRARVSSLEVADSGGRQIYAAATVLGLYGSWGLAGGPALPLYQSLNGGQVDEGLRLALNLTFWY